MTRVMLISDARLDFGYPWWLSYGHCVVLLPVIAVLIFGYIRRSSKWLMLLLSVLVLWSGTAFIVTRFVFNANGIPALSTENFLRSGTGRVLDIGAGTGRSSIMVLLIELRLA